MTILTKNVIIENKAFYLIQSEYDGKTFYGTIAHNETKKQLNGAEMCISYESIADAIEHRKRNIIINEYLEANKLDPLENPAHLKQYAEWYAKTFN